MNVLLFYPRGRPFDPLSRNINHLAAMLPPLGLASIASVLRENGHIVSIIDAASRPEIQNDAWARRIVSARPDMVGFSANTPAFLDACDVCRRVKDLAPSVKTVFGGVHASSGRDRLLEEFGAIDFVVAGEGETAVRQLAGGDNHAMIAGLHYRDGSRVLSGPVQDRSTLCAMDDLPFPAYDLIDGFPQRYNLPLFGYRHHPGAHIISSRGCTYQCTYCDRSVFGRSFRWNSAQYTFEQVRKLNRDFGVRHVYFYDDLFTLNRGRVARLCELLTSAKLGIGFNCIVRVGHVDDELLGMLKRAGCFMVNVGIESGDQRILDANKDGLRLEDIRRDVTKIHSSGIHVKGLFMMGFPGETEESIRKTIDLACELPLKDANMTAFTPFPGAPITREIDALGSFDNDWDKLDCEHFVFVSKEIGSRELLENLYKSFIRRFYNRPFARKMYRRMMLECPHSYWRLLKDLPKFLGYKSAFEK